MTTTAPPVDSDVWSDWLLHHRHGGDPGQALHIRAKTLNYADEILDAVPMPDGGTLLDVGAGEGLVAFRALERIGPSLSVILADTSVSILDHARSFAHQAGISVRCRFVKAAAEDLSPIADNCVDLVTSRSVLAYVDDKLAAFREFYRVLKADGRISIAEPIMRHEALTVAAMKILLERRSQDSREALLPLLHRWKSAQFPDTLSAIELDPITNYSEHDLSRFLQRVWCLPSQISPRTRLPMRRRAVSLR